MIIINWDKILRKLKFFHKNRVAIISAYVGLLMFVVFVVTDVRSSIFKYFSQKSITILESNSQEEKLTPRSPPSLELNDIDLPNDTLSSSLILHFLQFRNGTEAQQEEAVESLKWAIKRERNNCPSRTHCLLYTLLGKYFFDNNRIAEAIEELEKAKKIDTQENLPIYYLIQSYQLLQQNLIKSLPAPERIQEKVRELLVKINQLKLEYYLLNKQSKNKSAGRATVEEVLLKIMLAENKGAFASLPVKPPPDQSLIQTTTDIQCTGTVLESESYTRRWIGAGKLISPAGTDNAILDAYFDALEDADPLGLNNAGSENDALFGKSPVLYGNVAQSDGQTWRDIAGYPRNVGLNGTLTVPPSHAFELAVRIGAEANFGGLPDVDRGLGRGDSIVEITHEQKFLASDGTTSLRKAFTATDADMPNLEVVEDFALVANAATIGAKAEMDERTSMTVVSYGQSRIAEDLNEVHLHKPTSDNRLLSIGIDDYSNINRWNSLNYAVSDAKKISDEFTKYGFKSRLLKNAEATKSRMLEFLLRENLISKPNDTFVLYFAGHGFTDASGEQFVVPFNRKGNIEVISLSEIEALLESYKGKAYVIIDTCSKQMLDVDLSSWYRQQHIASSHSLERGGNKLLQNKILTTKNKNPSIIISSSRGQVAFESASLQSGIASYKLIEYLKNNRDKHHIDFKEVFKYIEKQTPVLAKSKQIPQNPQIYRKRDSTASGFSTFSKSITATDADTPNLEVDKDFAFVADAATVGSKAEMDQRASMTVVSYDQPSITGAAALCPWVQTDGTEEGLPATNELIAGASSFDVALIVGETNTSVTTTAIPSFYYRIKAAGDVAGETPGLGTISAAFAVQIQEGVGPYVPPTTRTVYVDALGNTVAYNPANTNDVEALIEGRIVAVDVTLPGTGISPLQKFEQYEEFASASGFSTLNKAIAATDADTPNLGYHEDSCENAR